jgi:hypothetical protein
VKSEINWGIGLGRGWVVVTLLASVQFCYRTKRTGGEDSGEVVEDVVGDL